MNIQKEATTQNKTQCKVFPIELTNKEKILSGIQKKLKKSCIQTSITKIISILNLEYDQ